MMSQLRIVVACAVLFGCGVEAGNPTTGKTPKGMARISINFSGVKDIFEGQLLLNLTKIDLLGSNGTSDVTTTVVPSSDSLDLSGADSDASVSAVGSQTVPVGTYSQLAFYLNEDRPMDIFAPDGARHDVNFADKGKSAFTQAENLELIEGETTEVLITIDPRLSFSKEDFSDSYEFMPRTAVSRPGRGGALEGDVTASSALWVCSYLFKPLMPPHPEAPPGHRPPPPPPNGVAAEPPPYAESAEAVQKDTDATCLGAFDRVPVVNGHYKFKNLPPGMYDLRLFHADGHFEDILAGILVEPPHNKEEIHESIKRRDRDPHDHRGGHPP